MKKNLQSNFSHRQYMVSQDFEVFYYNDQNLSKVNLHMHNYYEFYFFLEGSVSIQIDRELYQLSPGDLILVPPNISHRPVIHTKDSPYRRFVFWISEEYCRYLLSLSPDYGYLMEYVQINRNYIFHNDPITFHAIQAKLIRLLEEIHGNCFGKEAQISLLVNDLVLHLNRLIYHRKNPRRMREDCTLYQNLTAYIEDHLEEDLSLDVLAKNFFVSKYHIAHIFKENLGMSVHQYITKKRLILCREAIRGNMSITEACQTFGFGDYSSFYRAFKKEYGMSPRDFRDMQTVNLD